MLLLTLALMLVIFLCVVAHTLLALTLVSSMPPRACRPHLRGLPRIVPGRDARHQRSSYARTPAGVSGPPPCRHQARGWTTTSLHPLRARCHSCAHSQRDDMNELRSFLASKPPHQGARRMITAVGQSFCTAPYCQLTAPHGRATLRCYVTVQPLQTRLGSDFWGPYVSERSRCCDCLVDLISCIGLWHAQHHCAACRSASHSLFRFKKFLNSTRH